MIETCLWNELITHIIMKKSNKNTKEKYENLEVLYNLYWDNIWFMS